MTADVVLVTGAARPLGSRLARLLSAEVDRVVGVDVIQPVEDIGKAEFVRADIRSPVIAKVLAASGAQVVVHMGVLATPRQAGGRATMKETNVIGTMQLLAACQRSSIVAKVVVKSTSSVYGSGPKDPARFTEDTAPKSPPRAGWGKDSVEVEEYVRGFSRRRPDVTVTTLRFANVMGPTLETSMTQYFELPVLPTVLGFDARLQFVHESDMLEVLRRATLDDLSGTYNVAGDGVLMLHQAARRAGRPTMAVPRFLAGAVGGFARRGGVADFSAEQIAFLTYGRCMDTTALTERFGYECRYTTAEAFSSFIDGHLDASPFAPSRVLEVLPGSCGIAKGSDA